MGRITYEEFKKNGGKAVLCRNPENVEEDHGPNEDLWPVEYSSRSLKEFLDHEDLEHEFFEFCDLEGMYDLGMYDLSSGYRLTPDLLELNNEDTLVFSIFLNAIINPLYGVIYHAD